VRCGELLSSNRCLPETDIEEQLNQRQRFNRATMYLRSGDAASAAEVCERSLKKFPGDANLLCLSAKANLALKEFGKARSRLQDAIRLFPDFALAHETFGDLLLVQGRAEEARRAYEQALRLDHTSLEIHGKIERAVALEASITSAADSARLAAQNRRRMAYEAEIGKGMELERDGDSRAAEMIYREILKKDPDHVEAARLLAKIAVAKKQFHEAEIFLKKALSTAPDYLRAWVDLVQVQREQDKFNDAVDSARKVLELSPDKAESHILYAGAIGMTGDHEAAIRAYEKVLEIAPGKAGAMCGLAHHQKTIGLGKESIASYRRAIAIKPDHAEAYWSLANLKTFRFDDAEVQAMQNLLARNDLPDESRCQVHNALGLELEARKEFAAAFAHFEQCNAIRRKAETYDPVKTESTCNRLIGMFDADFLAAHDAVPRTDITPILIVGLPRSGSTLIEQILASHSQVDGTHELGDLSRVIHGARKRKKINEVFPDELKKLDVDGWAAIGTNYIERTRIFRHGAPFFIDKNPNNFVYAGIVKIAMPNAKIIDARRHPLDSCFGSFKQLFASGQPFTYDMEELAEYYLQYRRLMDHWQAVMPGFIHQVDYENVVADLEGEVRRLLEFCGLPFEDACLRFHETERAIKTASSQQVRQPIYSGSVNLWRNYEPQLAQLVQILESRLIDLPPDDRPGSLAGKPPA
jgi:tetratricopeptide (TPR) repeat protein